jgi:F0F1-type ATP synthase delta subunit
VAGQKLSRRKIAAYCADELIAGRDVMDQLAAYLAETGRTREADLVIRDIEAALADRGLVVADVQSSQTLGDETKSAISSFLGNAMKAEKVVLRESVDESLLGGVRITAAGSELDATLRRRLNQLKASKI